MRWISPSIRASWLGLLALILATPTAVRAGSIFDALPHMKRPSRPICNHYSECYGHFSVSYRPWPTQCVVNPPLPPGKQPIQQTLPSPRLVPEDAPRMKKPEGFPLPGPAPKDASGRESSVPSIGVLLEVEDEPVEAGRTANRITPANARQYQPATRPAVPRTQR